MAAAVPVVEVADHRDARGIGRPDGEMHADAPSWSIRCAPSLSKSLQMRALGDVIIVHRPEHRAEGIGVRHSPFAAGIARADSAAAGGLRDRDRDPRRSRHRMARRQFADRASPASVKAVAVLGMRDEAARDEARFQLRERPAPRTGRHGRRPRWPSTSPDRCFKPASGLVAAWGRSSSCRVVTPSSPFQYSLPRSCSRHAVSTGNVPDFLGILADGAVGREPAHPRRCCGWPATCQSGPRHRSASTLRWASA